eukprot:1258240-Pyramimonas_sp.AAC.1
MVSHCSGEDVSAHQLNEKMISAFRHAADRCLPEAARWPKRPWISEQIWPSFGSGTTPAREVLLLKNAPSASESKLQSKRTGQD